MFQNAVCRFRECDCALFDPVATVPIPVPVFDFGEKRDCARRYARCDFPPSLLFTSGHAQPSRE